MATRRRSTWTAATSSPTSLIVAVIDDELADLRGKPSSSTASRARSARPMRWRTRSRSVAGTSTAAVLVDVPDDVVAERISGRGQGRDDDDPETVKERLRVYHGETEPLVRYYDERGLLRRSTAPASRRVAGGHPRRARRA